MAGETKKKAGKSTSKTTGKTTAKTAAKTAVKAKSTTTKTSKAAKPTKTAKVSKSATTVKKAAKPRSSVPKIDWQAFTEKMEQFLTSQKTEIIGNLVASNNDFKEIVDGMDPKDFADIASDDIDRKMIEAIGSQELRRLKLIDSAITRIKQGKYGYCIKCDKRIPPARLEAIPYALMCIECKSEEERRNR